MSARSLTFLVACAVLAPACSAIVSPDPGRLGGTDAGTSPGVDAPGLDAPGPALDAPLGLDAPDPTLDGGPSCPTDCDDGVACTTDSCDATGTCRNVTNDAACGGGMRCVATGCVAMVCVEDADCDDGDACNGEEHCSPGSGGADPVTGCLGGGALDCDDGFDCTTDDCAPATGCTHAADNAACDDSIDCTVDVCRLDVGCVRTPNPGRCTNACIPTPICSPTMGCTGTPLTCMSDGNPCTSDPTMCDLASGTCLHPPRDGDGDGYPIARATGTGGTVVTCAGGTDCNDADRAVNPGATEVCNGRDDDCDGTPDDGITCVPVDPENCATASAIPLTPGSTGLTGTVTGSTVGNVDDYRPSCGGTGGPDAVYYVDIPGSGPGGAFDVVITTNNAATNYDTVLAAQVGGTCGAWPLCNDDIMSGNNRSTIRTCVTPGASSGTRVHILVDGFNTAAGTYNVTVTVTPRASGVCG